MSGRSGSGVSFSHLQRLSDSTGLFEHALLTERRLEHGYCVDDVARGLVVTTREPAPDPATAALAAIYQRFLASARDADGIRNRLGADLMWEDSADVKDCWGRALWGLGTAAARSSSSRLASEALTQFETSAGRRSRWTRAMAFAALGAAEVLTVHPDHGMARPCWPTRPPSSTRWARRRRGPPPTGTGRRAACGTPMRSFPRRCSPQGTFSKSHAGSHADWTCSDGFSMSRQPVSTSLSRLQADGRGASPGRASTSSPSRSQPWRTPALGPTTSPGTPGGPAQRFSAPHGSREPTTSGSRWPIR